MLTKCHVQSFFGMAKSQSQISLSWETQPGGNAPNKHNLQDHSDTQTAAPS